MSINAPRKVEAENPNRTPENKGVENLPENVFLIVSKKVNDGANNSLLTEILEKRSDVLLSN